MSALLRVALPPLARLSADSQLSYAWLNRQGALVEQGEQPLRALSTVLQGKPLELCLHPEDSLLTGIELPPLPPARMGDAVRCAAENLLLGSLDSLHLVHGPRSATGQVQLAWLDRTALLRLLKLLQQHALQPRGLYPAPYFLALAEPGSCTALVRDEHLLVREDLQRAWVHPLVDEGREQLRERGVQWASSPLTNGPVPGWNLLHGIEHTARARQHWGRASASCAVAALVWTVGLNLYAGQMAGEGQALKAQMVSRVKEVFPQLPVILNPLQQARQQRDARLNGALADGPVNFAALVQQASGQLPFMAGGVEALNFDGTELHLTARSAARKPPADSTWQTGLAQVGVQAELANGQWTLRRLPADANIAPAAGAADE